MPASEEAVMKRTSFAVFAFVIAAAFGSLTAQEVFTPKDGATLPVPVRQVKAGYTTAAMDARIEGSVVMDVVVLADGKVGNVAVTESLDKEYGLDTQAVEAVKQWLFKPGTKDGKAVAVRVTIQMTFRLK
jgi:periplasmic protein TonB